METPNQVTNPLLSRIQLPGETFTLPSGGVFYKDGELHSTVKDAEIHVHPMTALDEIVLKTPDLLFSGEGVKQVFQRCIPQVVKTDDLLAKDVDYLLVCLRKVSYGEELRVTQRHNCKNAKDHTYTLDLNDFIRSAKRIDPTTVNQTFTATMPNDQKVLLRPIRYADFIKVMQTSTNEKMEPEELKELMVDSMARIIVQVDEVDDSSMIKEWLREVPPSFHKSINDQIDKTLEWGPEFTTKIICKDCSRRFEVTAPLNPLAFFT